MNTKYQIDRLKTNNENFPKSVKCIIKDNKGFMWFGTPYGLYRFDGYNFKVYTHESYDKDSISTDNVTCICDDNNYLWIGTSAGLNRFDKTTEKFKVYKCDSYNNFSIGSNVVWSIYLMKSGELWLGTREGLNRFDKTSERFFNYTNSAIEYVDHFINSICEDDTGDLWIGTNEIGAVRYNIKDNKFKKYKFNINNSLSLSNNWVVVEIINIGGDIWIATYGGGISKFDKEKEIFYSYQHDTLNQNSILSNEIITMAIDEEKNFWCVTDEGISIVDTVKNKITNLNKRDYPLSLNNISIIYADNQGTVWIYNNSPADRSISTYNKNKRKFNHYKNIQGSGNNFSNRVISICDDENGNILLGTPVGIDILNRNQEKISHIENNPDDPDSLINNYIWNIYRDKKNYIWLATYNDALERYDPRTEKFTHIYDSDGKGFVCHHIFEDKKENLWLGLMKGGVRVFDKNRELIKKYLQLRMIIWNIAKLRFVKFLKTMKKIFGLQRIKV